MDKLVRIWLEKITIAQDMGTIDASPYNHEYQEIMEYQWTLKYKKSSQLHPYTLEDIKRLIEQQPKIFKRIKKSKLAKYI